MLLLKPLGTGFIPGQAQTALEPGSKRWFSHDFQAQPQIPRPRGTGDTQHLASYRMLRSSHKQETLELLSMRASVRLAAEQGTSKAEVFSQPCVTPKDLLEHLKMQVACCSLTASGDLHAVTFKSSQAVVSRSQGGCDCWAVG